MQFFTRQMLPPPCSALFHSKKSPSQLIHFASRLKCTGSVLPTGTRGSSPQYGGHLWTGMHPTKLCNNQTDLQTENTEYVKYGEYTQYPEYVKYDLVSWSLKF